MEETQVHIDLNEEIGFMNVDETDFSNFTLGQQIRHLEVQGYVILPDVLDAELMEEIKAEMATMPMATTMTTESGMTFKLEMNRKRTSFSKLTTTNKRF